MDKLHACRSVTCSMRSWLDMCAVLWHVFCRTTFLTIAGLAAVQSVASCLLFLRTRPIYRAEFARLQKYKRETHDPAGAEVDG